MTRVCLYTRIESGDLDPKAFRCARVRTRDAPRGRERPGPRPHPRTRTSRALDRRHGPLAAVADRLDDTIANGGPDPSKAPPRLLIAGLRVNSRSEILPAYRVADLAVCAQRTSVEPAGLEPAASSVQGKRSSS
jgi:hypothetical protein